MRYVDNNRLPRDIGLIRKLTSLALLPPNIIEKTFFDLKSEYDEEEHKVLFSYVFRNWIRLVSTKLLKINVRFSNNYITYRSFFFKPELISTYNFPHNTNNICESFNNYLKTYEGIFVNFTKNMNFWLVKGMMQFLFA